MANSTQPATVGNSTTPANKKVDIQAIIEDWAITYFRSNASRKERKLLEKKLIHMEIDWKRVQFVHQETVYSPPPPPPGTSSSGHRPIPNVLFQTTFANRTEREQTYVFRAERKSKSTCSVTVEQACTTGVEVGICLKTPCEILEANAGFRREMTLANCEEETIEEEMTWSVDSQVAVLEHHVGEAKLILLEQEYEGHFSVSTRISGRVRVLFTNLKDNNSFIRAAEGQIVEIVKKAFSEGRLKPSEALKTEGSALVTTATGKCRFKYGFKQMIEVDQKPISDVES